MSFLYPQFLYALFALSIPIIIHFLTFRRHKRVYFTNVSLLRDAQKKDRSFKRLRSWLILASRLLALAALVLAFARPYLPQEDDIPGAKSFVSVYIDNSFSMLASTKEGSLLDKAKLKAREILDGYSEFDRFQLLTNEFASGSRTFYTKEEFLEQLASVKESPQVKAIDQIVARQQQAWQESDRDGKLSSYVLSDFQKSTIGSPEAPDSTAKLYLVPVSSEPVQNVSIDSAWFESEILRKDVSASLNIRVRSFSTEALDAVSLTYSMNGEQKGFANFDLAAEESKVVSVNVKIPAQGWNQMSIGLRDYPIQFDNDYYLSFYVREKLSILSIDAAGVKGFVKQVFAAEPFFDYKSTTEGSVDYLALLDYDFVIVNGLAGINTGLQSSLLDRLAEGRPVLVIPPEKIDASYQQALLGLGIQVSAERKDVSYNLAPLDPEIPFFHNVFESLNKETNTPKVLRYYKLQAANSRYLVAPLSMPSGDVFLAYRTVNEGKLFVLASPLSMDWSSFPKHALFVPSMFKMALSLQEEQAYTTFLGASESFRIPMQAPSEDAFHIKGANGDWIPQQRYLDKQLLLWAPDEISQPGFYDLVDAAGNEIALLALNQSRLESDPTLISSEELSQWALNAGVELWNDVEASLAAKVKQAENSAELWQWFIRAALFFLLAEVLVLKLMKT